MTSLAVCMGVQWAHSMEGALDTAHFPFLHMPAPAHFSNEDPTVAADERRMRWLRDDPMPQFTIVEHDVGFAIGGARRADGEEFYWRITQFMLPTHSVTPSATRSMIRSWPGAWWSGTAKNSRAATSRSSSQPCAKKGM